MEFISDIFRENSGVSSKRVLAFSFFITFCFFGALDKKEVAFMAMTASCGCVGVTAYQKIKQDTKGKKK